MGSLLDPLEARLAERAYLLGSEYSLADLIVACVLTYSTYCGVAVGGRARVNAWLERFHARESFRNTWGDAASGGA